ncbi:heme ABC transporter ATP-binding protein/permease CydC [Shewanella salipaludis]|uniref:Glutathione/L-cysteine transport system ATP-binding/permease protein CydC n=1 Tax=Shewanella salipaludis TaxID=2723052 RepID=A0A972FVC9_9GAMM|nr:cysteine/glutathione ABC transporter ATP-binding protein/permease CydC [Shewanella salipaludis]NMH66446.1 cysteine/glutathione ABC transporter ATP-binding protein/permease CydC [Shewanella salipaludis]
MSLLWPFLRLFKRQWQILLLGMLLSLFTLAAGIGLLSLSGWFLSATAVAGLSLATAQAFNFFTPAAGVRFFSIGRTLSRYGERLATHEATFRLLTRLRIWVWQRLMPLSAANLQGLRRGELLNLLLADIDTLDHLYLRLLTPMLASLLMTLGLYLFLANFDAALALVLCGLLLAAWLLLPLLFYRLGDRAGRDTVDNKRRLRVLLLEYLQGQAELTLFGANGGFLARLDAAERALFGSQTAMARVTALSQALLVLVNGAALLLVLYLAAAGIGDRHPPGPLLGLMVLVTMACAEMLQPIAGAFSQLSACVQSAGRILALTEQTPAIRFAEETDSGGRGPAQTGRLALDDIYFGYAPGEPVLEGLSLRLEPGTKVALLGPTGCGKSSLLALISRQWQPQAGGIRLDDRPIEAYGERALRQSMSLVSQRIHLFSGSLRDNLALALPGHEGDTTDVKANDERLMKVLHWVGLGSLLEGKAPLDAWIGEGGRQLSGGERRRIGVARALLRDAPLLLLDEPTEGLDKQTEREILALLFAFARDKTLLLISHRLTAMAQMDEIHLLQQGKIAASGNHETLLASNAYYQSLYRRLS